MERSMEARLYSTTCVVAAVCLMGAAYRTTNFVVSAPTPELAKAIGDAAEVYRGDLSQEWLGHELPDWTVCIRRWGIRRRWWCYQFHV